MIPINIPPQQQTQQLHTSNENAENNSEEFCDNVTKTRESDKLHSEKNPTPASNEATPIIIETTVVPPPSPPSSTQPLEGGQHRKVSTSSPASSPKRPRMLGPQQSPGNGHQRPKIHNSNWPRTTNNMQPAMNIDFSLMSKPPPGGGVQGHAHQQQQRGYNNQARTYYNRNQNPPHRGGYQRHGGGGYHSQQPLNKNVKDSNS